MGTRSSDAGLRPSNQEVEVCAGLAWRRLTRARGPHGQRADERPTVLNHPVSNGEHRSFRSTISALTSRAGTAEDVPVRVSHDPNTRRRLVGLDAGPQGEGSRLLDVQVVDEQVQVRLQLHATFARGPRGRCVAGLMLEAQSGSLLIGVSQPDPAWLGGDDAPAEQLRVEAGQLSRVRSAEDDSTEGNGHHGILSSRPRLSGRGGSVRRGHRPLRIGDIRRQKIATAAAGASNADLSAGSEEDAAAVIEAHR